MLNFIVYKGGIDRCIDFIIFVGDKISPKKHFQQGMIHLIPKSGGNANDISK